MITPEEIVQRLERKYREVLRAWLAGETIFPIEFPVGTFSNNLQERRHQIEILRNGSREVSGHGYHLHWETINKRDLGKQIVPERVIVENLDHYLALLRKRTEFNTFSSNVQKIRQRLPALESWMQASPYLIIEHAEKWDDLLTVCHYFIKHPRPNFYIRELPISLHTKFIEQNIPILRVLLDMLLPIEAIDPTAATFNKRFGLKEAPTLVRLRLLEDQLEWQYGIRVTDMTLPIDQMAHLLKDHVKPRYVFIVENLMNLLTLPRIPNSIGIFGGGFSVHVLAGVYWLANCQVIYWGDIDAHGFEILSDLRGLFPNSRSVMMDFETLNMYADYVGRGKVDRLERFDQLTAAELAIAKYVVENDLRLEQEHISQEYVIVKLRASLAEVR